MDQQQKYASFRALLGPEIGVKRVSLGSKLFLTAFGAFIRAAKEMRKHGTFKFSSDAIDFSELENYFVTFESH